MAKKKTKSKSSKAEEALATIPLKYHIPDTIITRFSTNMTVQILQSEFKICFFEAKPEIRLGPNPKPINEVQADCVASIVVTPDRLSKFIDVLQEQLKKYNSLQPELKKLIT